MIHLSALDANKALIEVMVDMVQGGILFSIIEGNTVTWRKCSETFNLDLFPLDSSLDSDSSVIKAIQERKVINEYIPRKVYGKRLRISTIPILKEDNTEFGALSVAVPILHPVAASFDEFAPILAEMFYDGAVLYLSDLTKVAYRKASKKFDIPFLNQGQELKETDIPSEVIKAKKPILVELDESILGVPVFSACFPLFDEENTDEIVATLGLIIPKRTAVTLREMSAALEDSLSGISSAIQQMAASATEIHNNEQMLNASIKEIITISNDINEVSAFIKRIADQTKMLGLNASIEAARAGEAGKGFGVVAEEIRKLSDQSKSTVPKIHKLTEAIQAKVDDAIIKSHNSLSSSEEQAAATEEITSSIEEITSMSTELTKIAIEV